MTDTQAEYCVICSDELTLKNVVNSICGHQQCKDCFWRWAKTSNQCPFCRADMIPRDRKKELEMKNMLERRLEVLNELDSLYSEELTITDSLKQKKIRLKSMEQQHQNLRCKIYKKTNILERINEWENDPELAMNTWKTDNERYMAMKKERDRNIENNNIRLQFVNCLNEFEEKWRKEKNIKIIRGTSKKHNQAPILNLNINPVSKPWVSVRGEFETMDRNLCQSPSYFTNTFDTIGMSNSTELSTLADGLFSPPPDNNAYGNILSYDTIFPNIPNSISRVSVRRRRRVNPNTRRMVLLR